MVLVFCLSVLKGRFLQPSPTGWEKDATPIFSVLKGRFIRRADSFSELKNQHKLN